MKIISMRKFNGEPLISLRGTVRESSSGPSIPSCTGAGPKREQNLIHSELKAVPDRFTSYSRFGEIYNGKRCYIAFCTERICRTSKIAMLALSSTQKKEGRVGKKSTQSRLKTVVNLQK